MADDEIVEAQSGIRSKRKLRLIVKLELGLGVGSRFDIFGLVHSRAGPKLPYKHLGPVGPGHRGPRAPALLDRLTEIGTPDEQLANAIRSVGYRLRRRP